MTAWVAIDFETANEHRGSPCAVAMVAVDGDRVVDRRTTFIQPPPSVGHFSPFCVSLHGITEAVVRDAPAWPEALAEIEKFVDGRVVVAHNAAFDLGVVRSACDEMALCWPDLTYACSLVVARRTWQLLSYSLPWVAEAAGHTLTDHHDPLSDALAAAHIMLAAKKVHGVVTLPELLDALRMRFGSIAGTQWSGCRHVGASQTRSAMPGANSNADPDGPLYGLSICFTGTLSNMERRRAQELVAECGGQPVTNVSKKTALLVVGMQDRHRLVPGATMSSKEQKAAGLLEKGHSIEIISEADFLERLQATEGVALSGVRT
jgi:DNA polymerase-3 subunit epsilon